MGETKKDDDGGTITITKEETKIETSTGKPKVVIVHNDDFNTFPHVISCLVKICKLDQHTAEVKTFEIHEKGKSIVSEGNDDQLKKVKLQLGAEGLIATIEGA